MPDAQEIRQPDFHGLRLAEDELTMVALISRNCQLPKIGVLEKRAGLRRLNHRFYGSQVSLINDLQRICDYGKLLVFSDEVFEHVEEWPDPMLAWPPGPEYPGWPGGPGVFPGGGGMGGSGGGGGGGKGGSAPTEPFIDPNWPPVAVASVDEPVICLGVASRFTGSDSWDPDAGIASYHWDFGDGNTSNEPNPTHTYAADGLYNVTLTVMDDEGEIGTATLTVGVRPPAFTWRAFSVGSQPVARVVHNPDHDEFAVFYGRAGDNDLLMQVFGADGNIVLAETVIATDAGKNSNTWAASWDGEQYGVIYAHMGAPPNVRIYFRRVNRGGVSTAVTLVEVTDFAHNPCYALSWNAAGYLAAYPSPTTPLVRIALLTDTGVINAGPVDLNPSQNGNSVTIDTDGAGWLIAYLGSFIVPMLRARYITGAFALGAAQAINGALGAGNTIEPQVAWNGTSFGVSYWTGANVCLQRYATGGAAVGGEIIVVVGADLPALSRRASGWCYAYRDPATLNQMIQRLDVGGNAIGAPLPTGQPAAVETVGTLSPSGVAFVVDDDLGIGECLGE